MDESVRLARSGMPARTAVERVAGRKDLALMIAITEALPPGTGWEVFDRMTAAPRAA